MDVSPFLLFEGNCAEAMAFYQCCLGGELEIVDGVIGVSGCVFNGCRSQRIASVRISGSG